MLFLYRVNNQMLANVAEHLVRTFPQLGDPVDFQNGVNTFFMNRHKQEGDTRSPHPEGYLYECWQNMRRNLRKVMSPRQDCVTEVDDTDWIPINDGMFCTILIMIGGRAHIFCIAK